MVEGYFWVFAILERGERREGVGSVGGEWGGDGLVYVNGGKPSAWSLEGTSAIVEHMVRSNMN